MFYEVDEYMRLVTELIDQHGWIVQGVSDPDRPWAYTVGLTRYNRRELVIVGFPAPLAAQILNTAARRHKGIDFFPDTPVNIPDFPVPFRLREINASPLAVSRMMFSGHEHYQGTALQLLWPTDDGRYPGEPGYDCMSQDIHPNE